MVIRITEYSHESATTAVVDTSKITDRAVQFALEQAANGFELVVEGMYAKDRVISVEGYHISSQVDWDGAWLDDNIVRVDGEVTIRVSL